MDDSLSAGIILVFALLIALVPLSMIVKVVMRVYWVSRALTGGRAGGGPLRTDLYDAADPP